MYNLPQKLLAEFVGTFTLIFIGAGSICADALLRAGAGPGVGILGIAVAHGLAIGIMVTALGHISGGHFNPAVTIGFWVTKKLSTLHSISYWIAQLLGGIAGGYLLRAVMPSSVWPGPVWLGTPMLAPDYSRAHGMLLEGVMTFLLVFVIFATAVDSHGAASKVAGFAIGLTITMDILMGGPLTGAAMNPARAVGPALASHQWANHGVYWVGPLLGGVIAGWLYNAMLLREN